MSSLYCRFFLKNEAFSIEKDILGQTIKSSEASTGRSTYDDDAVYVGKSLRICLMLSISTTPVLTIYQNDFMGKALSMRVNYKDGTTGLLKGENITVFFPEINEIFVGYLELASINTEILVNSRLYFYTQDIGLPYIPEPPPVELTLTEKIDLLCSLLMEKNIMLETKMTELISTLKCQDENIACILKAALNTTPDGEGKFKGLTDTLVDQTKLS